MNDNNSEMSKIKLREQQKKYRDSHRAERRIQNKIYKANHKGIIRLGRHIYYERHKEELRSRENDRAQKYRHQIRTDALNAFGNKCACCGETEPKFLSVDHINGGGTKHRKLVGVGCQFYLWLKNNNYPKDNFQLLCHNCNMAKGLYGECPHETNRKVMK